MTETGRLPPAAAIAVSALAEVPTPGPSALVAGPPVHLNAKKNRHEEMISRVDSRIETRATSILNNYLAAADLDDPSEERPFVPKPEGWSERKFRIAKDGRKPLKQQPGYLAAAQRVKEAFTRARGERVEAPRLNIEVQVSVRQEFSYPVIDVTEREK